MKPGIYHTANVENVINVREPNPSRRSPKKNTPQSLMTAVEITTKAPPLTTLSFCTLTLHTLPQRAPKILPSPSPPLVSKVRAR
jgi:hypothetical protein